MSMDRFFFFFFLVAQKKFAIEIKQPFILFLFTSLTHHRKKKNHFVKPHTIYIYTGRWTDDDECAIKQKCNYCKIHCATMTR